MADHGGGSVRSPIGGDFLSEASAIVEHMFDSSLREAPDADVVAAMARFAAAEAAAAAGLLAAVGELVRRRCSEDDRADWSCDGWDSAAAEVSAALGMSHGRASGQMYLSLALKRLPRVAALFAEGVMSRRVVSAIARRTDLVRDDDALSAIDAALADHARNWGTLSDHKLEQAIDVWVDQVDPDALRRIRTKARGRDIEIGGCDDESGTSTLWGRLFSADALVLKKRLAQMATGVCDDDPRTMAQRRADALGALAAGSDCLACQCGSPRCPAPSGGAGAPVVIHVLTETAAAQTDPAPDPHISGSTGIEPYRRDMNLRDWLKRDSEPGAVCPQATSVILGGGSVPAPLLAELARRGATVREVRRPADVPEPGYRPSAALAEFVRMRDMTCRFPHCDRPAEHCDIDHAVAWPDGSTHPSNLRCLCRKHHLLKSFWTGPGGWTDAQAGDGSIRWTSPTGQTYTTIPGSRLLFPSWDTATADLPKPSGGGHQDGTDRRALKMPRRRRTRVAQTACRIRHERRLNVIYGAERAKPPPY